MGRVLLFDLETTGLSPLSSRVTCVSCKVFGEDSIVSFSGDFEARILEDFAQFVGQQGVSKLVAFNGWSFDVPFLRVRALANKVKLPSIFWVEGVLSDPFHILARSKKGKQVEFAQLVGVGQDLLFGNGKQCLSWFERGEHDKIKKHCESDIRALDALYSRMVECGYL